MSGRLAYGVVSDTIGPSRTLTAFGLFGIPACFSIPYVIDLAAVQGVSDVFRLR